MKTAVIVPARNEADGLSLALWSLARQSVKPDMVIVVANNCTDDTEQLAWELSAQPGMPFTDVVSMPVNPGKKAGALNAGLVRLTQLIDGPLTSMDYVLTMDADTELHPEFIARSARVLASDPALGGVSASCLGRHITPTSLHQRFLLGMQRIEYGRYSSMRFRQNVHTMSGAGSFYRTTALQELMESRGYVFWGTPANLVEDYETTLALKELGWKITANQLCIARTDLMPTVGALVSQRERWVRGTVDVLRQRGWTRHTYQSILVLLLGLAGYIYTGVWIAMSALAVTHHGGKVELQYFWLVGFWMIYQVASVRSLGWRPMLVEALLIPEAVFGVLRMYWLFSSVTKSYLSATATWA